MKTDKLLPYLMDIKQKKEKINKSQPMLKLPHDKEEDRSLMDFNSFLRATPQGIMGGFNPRLNIGNASVGPYGVFNISNPEVLDYGLRGSYDINPNLSISGDVNRDRFNVGLNYKFAIGGPNNTPNYRDMAIANGIAAADYDKNKSIIDSMLSDVLKPGKYDPGFFDKAKIQIARSKYPNIDNIISNIDRTTYAEGGISNINTPITNQDGQHLFPGRITGIKGGDINQNGDYVTPLTGQGVLNNLITINPYGANKLQAGTKIQNEPGNFQLEIPMAQYGGGQEDQISQLIAAYAQISGLDPQEIIQKLQSLPQDQQQQALQAIAQQVQQAMAQQQGGAGQEQMGMAKMGGYPNYMAEGGEPCYECFDHYNPSPQAQNLNWFYKAGDGKEKRPVPAGDLNPIHTNPGTIKEYQEPGFFDKATNIISHPFATLMSTGSDQPTYNYIKEHQYNPIDVALNGAAMYATHPFGMLWPFATGFNDPLGKIGSKYMTPIVEKIRGTAEKNIGKKRGGPTNMMDDLYQPGRQVKTKPEPPNYQPNWFARRTSVPGQVLGAMGNFLPWFGSSMLSGGNDMINSYQGEPYYVPNTNIPYGTLSQYMINRRYANMKPIPEYDAIIQSLTPEQLQQLSGPIFKGGGEAFPQAQTYLPYDRPGEKRPNFMFKNGGEKKSSSEEYQKKLLIDLLNNQ